MLARLAWNHPRRRRCLPPLRPAHDSPLSTSSLHVVFTQFIFVSPQSFLTSSHSIVRAKCSTIVWPSTHSVTFHHNCPPVYTLQTNHQSQAITCQDNNHTQHFRLSPPNNNRNVDIRLAATRSINMKYTFAAVTVLAGASTVSAFWRMPCRSRTGAARLDPIIDIGTISDHVHTFHGGNAIGMETSYDDLRADSTCTSCEVTQDNSAYWTPTLHFMWNNGTSEMVEQVGGMLAYYLMYLEDPSTLETFPAGLRMVAGNRNVRNFTGPVPDTELSSWPTDAKDQFFLEQRALGFNCLNYNKDPEPSLYRHQFPSKDMLDNECTDGLRLELAFPSCGTGKTDSPDHKSHMAYPSLVKEGNCPPGYDHHYPFLFFETIWATNNYAGEDGYFTFSHGDPIGTGYHGDFIMGWDEDFLQSAIRTCTNLSGEIGDCPLFTQQTDAEAAQCTFDVPAVLENDDAAGPRMGLAEGVPIQWGEEPATKYPIPGRSGEATTSVGSYSKPSTHTDQATASYTAADASETATAQGGIIVAAAISGLHGAIGKLANLDPSDMPTSSSTSVSSTKISSEATTVAATPSAHVTSAVELDSASSSLSVVSTSYMTKGNEVLEMVIEQVDVTVTATATPSAHHKRHLHKHQHQHGRLL
nr:hypothetical protein CFP56_30834 [Quercus suber]